MRPLLLSFLVSSAAFAIPNPDIIPPRPPDSSCVAPAKWILNYGGFGPLAQHYHWDCLYIPPHVMRSETWFPAFKVVALFYAPPGKQSSVSYGGGSTLGSSQVTSFTTQAGTSFGGTLGFVSNVSVTQSFNFSIAKGHTERFTKGSGVTMGLGNGSGATDIPDHGYDTFWLWVNPKVELQYQDGILVGQQWSAADGATPEVIPFTVREIQGLDPVPAYKLAKVNGVTTANDIALLLSLDPFLAPGYKVDATRYSKVATQTIWGPDNAGDPVPTSTVNWTYSSGTDDNFVKSQGEQTAVTINTGFSLFGLIKGESHVGITFGVTFSQSSTESSTSNESASVTLRSTTPCHAMDVDVYFDRVFNSFVAVPATEYHCGQGTRALAKDSDGNPLRSQAVSYMRAGKSVQTYTDELGNYPVY